MADRFARASAAAPRIVPAALGLVAVLAVWAIAGAAVVRSDQSAMAVGAAIDFVLTAGLAIYVIAVRPGHLPRWVLGATLALGGMFAKLALGSADTAGAAMAAGLALEVGVLVLLAIRGRLAWRAWRTARVGGAATLDALTSAFTAARFPARLAGVIATEVTLLANVIVGWRRPVRTPALFTVHRNSGWPIYAGVIVFLTLIETSVVHILLGAYVSSTLAWIVTALSIYGALWLIGEVNALRHGGVEVGDHLELGIGIRWRARIAWSNVASIERCQPKPTGALDASILGANVLLHLREPGVVLGVLGRRREPTSIGLSIDEPDPFVTAVRARLTTPG